MVELLLDQPGDHGTLFFALEAARARTLADDVSGGRKCGRVGRDSSARSETGMLRERVRSLQSRLREAELSAQIEDAARLQGQVAHAERELLSHLRADAIFRAAQSTTGGADSVALDDLRSYLTPNQVFVEYFCVRNQILTLCIRREGVEVYQGLANAAEIVDVLSKLRFQFNLCARRGEEWVASRGATLVEVSRAYLQSLHELLVAPLGIGDEAQVIVAPYGPLHDVPFHALHSGTGYLLENCEIVVTPSATVWCGRRQSKLLSAQPLVMGAADEYAPLVEGEAREVGRLLGVRPYLGARASRAIFLRCAPKAGLIHLAAHATARGDNPHFSAIHFGDGPLAVHDLTSLGLRADLAVLSACATGSGVFRAGDEVMGLSRAFLAAGVQNLVVSLWPVWDQATKATMERLYPYLLAGERPATALRLAQMQLRTLYPHPYYWAPFVTVAGPSQ
jgi:hypothetical protein